VLLLSGPNSAGKSYILRNLQSRWNDKFLIAYEMDTLEYWKVEVTADRCELLSIINGTKFSNIELQLIDIFECADRVQRIIICQLLRLSLENRKVVSIEPYVIRVAPFRSVLFACIEQCTGNAIIRGLVLPSLFQYFGRLVKRHEWRLKHNAGEYFRLRRSMAAYDLVISDSGGADCYRKIELVLDLDE